MTRITGNRPTASMVVAMIALFVALGGGAYAATAAKNSVASKSIKNNQVKTIDIKDGSVRSTDILDGDVQSADLADGSVVASKIAADSVDGQRILDGSVAKADLAADARSTVVAFGKVFNPNGSGTAALHFPNGLTSVLEPSNDNGDTRVNVDPSVIPGGASQLPKCVIETTLTTASNPNGSLGEPGMINVAVGGGLPNGRIQVQTRNADGGLQDVSYYLQVICPQG